MTSQHINSTTPDNDDPASVAEKLEQTLAEWVRVSLPGGTPVIGEAARMAGMSVRTLQRRLAEQGLSYDRIVAGIRFGEAQRLLDETDRSINDIAQSLGYSNATHFARAFRRFAGMSPREYRNVSTH